MGVRISILTFFKLKLNEQLSWMHSLLELKSDF